MRVGGSFERTATKHMALNKFVGQIAGAASCLPIANVVFIDACTGNGRPNRFSYTSSPEIFAHHMHWLADHRVAVHGYFIESDSGTFAELERSVPIIGQKLGWDRLAEHLTLIPGDYRSLDVINQLTRITAETVVFIFIDPNSANKVGFPISLKTILPRLTTWFCTLGCNASGLKGYTVLADRLKWLASFNDLLNSVKFHQEAVLIRLEKDDNQWAYLINVPDQWRNRTEAVIGSLQKQWSKGMRYYWQTDARFKVIVRELFLTKEEIKEYYQPRLFPNEGNFY